MPELPKETIADKLLRMMEYQDVVSDYRPYLGYSGLGGNCKRSIWYSFRWVDKNVISKKLEHIFSIGDWEENNLIALLESIGAKVHGQQTEVKGLAGHVKGHIDCLISNLPFFENETLLGEFKTANDKSFKEFKQKGVQEKNRAYYFQMQAYMGHLKLNNACFIVRNKNDSNIYIEIVPFNQDTFDEIKKIELYILSSDEPPEKIGGRAWFECKWCHHLDVCHYFEKPIENCRTCRYGTIIDNGEWECERNSVKLSTIMQKEGCKGYQMLSKLREGMVK